MMPLEEITRRLREWQENMQATDEVMDALMTTVGCVPEAPLHSTISALQGLVTRQLAELIGTTEDWLGNWWLEDGFGEKPFNVRLPGEDWREITNIEELAKAIFDDLVISEKECKT